jgi:hypothetical protein
MAALEEDERAAEVESVAEYDVMMTAAAERMSSGGGLGDWIENPNRYHVKCNVRGTGSIPLGFGLTLYL